MKALTLWQPWASLIISGEKEFETRGWSTSYRGPLAIHASKKPFTKQMIEEYLFSTPIEEWLKAHEPFPIGAVLGIVEIVDMVATHIYTRLVSDKERELGDWHPDRWAWRLRVVEVFKEPIVCNGRQGLWDWERP